MKRLLALSLSTVLTCAVAAELGGLQTGQTKCYDASNHEVECSTITEGNAYYGQDGHYQKGTARSFTDNGDSTVTDNATGLIWDNEDTVARGTKTWADADTFCDNLTLASQTDWRLPTIKELSMLIDYSATSAPVVFSEFRSTTVSTPINYWSATLDVSNASNAWTVFFALGNTFPYSKANTYLVRCVRSGQ